jgi:hypothetical protein
MGDGTVEAHVGQAAEVVLRLKMHNNKPGGFGDGVQGLGFRV